MECNVMNYKTCIDVLNSLIPTSCTIVFKIIKPNVTICPIVILCFINTVFNYHRDSMTFIQSYIKSDEINTIIFSLNE